MRRLSTILILFLIGCSQNSDNIQINTDLAKTSLFKKIDSEKSGIDFVNRLPEDLRVNIFTYEYFYNGAGVAVGDINNDGLDDIYFTSNLGENKLYINKGSLRFEDITLKAGVEGSSGWSTGVTMVDINNDGFLDIYVCKSGRMDPAKRRNQLFINNGDLTFIEKSNEYGLDDAAYSTQALFFDFDRDGDLDMYLLNHSIENFDGSQIEEWLQTKSDDAGDKLFENKGGKFFDVTHGSGIIQTPLGYGLGVSAGDLNSDGWPDLYVSNDYVEHDYLYINQKDGTFKESIKKATQHISNFSMGVDIADFDNDGLDDIGVLDMVAEDNYRQKTNMASMNPQKFNQAVEYGFFYQYMFNTLQLNRGNTKFSEMAQLAGISNTDWSWSILFEDLNNDRWKDVFITNGFRKEFSNKDFINYRDQRMTNAMKSTREVRIRVIRELLDSLSDGALPNYVFQNDGDLTFTKRTEEWGLSEPTFSNGASLADLDNDGDLDMIVNNIDQVAGIYENLNRQNSENNYIQIALRGFPSNFYGIGATVEVMINGTVQRKHNFQTRGYQSAVPPYLHFGLAEYDKLDSIIVIWPNGHVQKHKTTSINQRIEVRYDQSKGNKYQKDTIKTLFKNSALHRELNYTHKENRYNDFEKQVLLPHKMSQFGPAMAVGDINGDGLEDIFIGGAKDMSGSIFLQNDVGEFEENVFSQHTDREDVSAVFFDADNDKDLDLYVVSGGNEFLSGDPMYRDRLYINDSGKFIDAPEALPDIRISGSVVRPYDVDGDGDLDLFVGGRMIPGKYPFPVSSSILINNGSGVFEDKTKSAAPSLMDLGMVTDAVWGDHDNDGDTDLLIVGEWMAPTIFENQEGVFQPVSDTNLSSYKGWWSSVVAIDIDEDGDLDFLAGNLGLNYKYKASFSEPFKVYAKDFDDNGFSDIVLGYYNDGELFPLRGRQCSSEQIPEIKKKFTSYHEFGIATLEEVYGASNLEEALAYDVTTFATSLFVNEGNGKYEVFPLPNMAQLSSVNGFYLIDINEDGWKDIVIGGNMYPVEVETTRNDASYGLLMYGKPDYSFVPVPMTESGICMQGDVKSLRTIVLANGNTGILAAVNTGLLQLWEEK